MTTTMRSCESRPHARSVRFVAAALLALVTSTTASGCIAPAVAGDGAAAANAPLDVRDLRGDDHDLDAVLASGRRVALVFWQTWCPATERQAEALAAAARAQGDAIEFVGIVPGERDARGVLETAARFDLGFPQVLDPRLDLTSRFAVAGSPAIVVLGEGRRELYRGQHAPADWTRLGAPESDRSAEVEVAVVTGPALALARGR